MEHSKKTTTLKDVARSVDGLARITKKEFRAVRKEIGNVRGDFQQEVGGLRQGVDDLRLKMREGFDRLYSHLALIERDIKEIKSRLDELETKVDVLMGKSEQDETERNLIRDELEKVKKRVVSVEARLR